MDDSSSSASLTLILAFSLIALNALITLAYAAIANSSTMRLQEAADDGEKGAQRILALLNLEPKLAITYKLVSALLQIGIALITSLVFLVPALQQSDSTRILIGVGMVLGIGLCAVLLGDIVPESIGSAYAKWLAAPLSGFLRLIAVLFNPLTTLVLAFSRLLSRAFGSSDLVNTVTEEEIMTLVNAGLTGGTIADNEREMIYSVLQLDETLVRELMVPRIDVIALDVESDLTNALDTFIDSGYSRIPVYEDNIDNIVGLLYAKDLLVAWRNGEAKHTTIRDLVRSAYFVPEHLSANDLLRDLRTRKVHMAVVADEYGGTSGIVTIENLLEEIVGDIQDEYDENEEAEYVLNGNGEYIIDATMDLDDFNELLDVNLDAPEADTLGGFIFVQLGRVPVQDELIETEDLWLRVTELDGHRIRKVTATFKPDESGDDHLISFPLVQTSNNGSKPINDDEDSAADSVLPLQDDDDDYPSEYVDAS